MLSTKLLALCSVVAVFLVPVTLAEVCRNKHDRCEFWAREKDYCDGPFKWWMVKNCKKSCDLCHKECIPEATIEEYSYAISKSKMNYQAALSHCESRGGELAYSDIHSMTVRQMLSRQLHFGNQQSFWIGLNRLQINDSVWRWADGEPAERKSVRWAPFAPKTRQDNDCAYIYRDDELTHKNLRTDNWYRCDQRSSFALCQFKCGTTCRLEFTAKSQWTWIDPPQDPHLFNYLPNCEWTISTDRFTNISLQIDGGFAEPKGYYGFKYDDYDDYYESKPQPQDHNKIEIFDGDNNLVAELTKDTPKNWSPERGSVHRFIVGPYVTLKFTTLDWWNSNFVVQFKGVDACETNNCWWNCGFCAMGDLYGDGGDHYESHGRGYDGSYTCHKTSSKRCII